MFSLLPRLYNKFFPYVAACMVRRREVQYAEREARRRQALYVRPRLEGLEERIVPDAYQFVDAPGPVPGDWTAVGNWIDLTTGGGPAQHLPGAMDTADIPNGGGPGCLLSSTTEQTVAGLTVEGKLEVDSKLSVTTMNTAGGSLFNLPTGGELDVLASADFGGGGALGGQIDAQGSSVTFDPGSSMVLGNGVQLIGSGVFNIFGPVTCNAALNQTALMVLDSNGGSRQGSLIGPGSLNEGGEFDWDGGVLGLAGGDDFIAAADLKLQGADSKELLAGTLTDGCNASELGGTNGLFIDAGATFDNEGNPGTDVTLPLISTRTPNGDGLFLNGADGFLDVKATTLIMGSFTNLGHLHVDPGSSLTVDGSDSFQDTVDLEGTLQLDGDVTLLGAILSSNGFIEDAGGGTLKIGDPSSSNGITAGSLTLASGSNSTISGFVEVTGTGTLTGPGFLNNSGMLKLDLGSVATIGSYQQSSIGTLEEHASRNGVNSKLAVSGDAQLSGTLDMEFGDGYTPAPGDTFTVLTAGAVDAHFDTTPDNMTVTYGPTSVGLTQN